MNRVVALALRQKLLVPLLLAALLVAGGIAFVRLNVEAYPDPVPPLVEIVTQSTGLSAEEIERNITIPVEVQMAGIPHITAIRAISWPPPPAPMPPRSKASGSSGARSSWGRAIRSRRWSRRSADRTMARRSHDPRAGRRRSDRRDWPMAPIATLLLAQAVASAPVPSPVPGVPPGVRIEATSSSRFTLQSPRLDMHGQAIHVEGIVCRRPLHLGLSPDKVQIERVEADGTISATIFALLPPLPRRFDQSCVRFGTPLKPPPVPGELIRICLAQKGSCAVAR